MSAFEKLTNIQNKTSAFVVVVYTLAMTFLVAWGGYLGNAAIYMPSMVALGIPVNTIYSRMMATPPKTQNIHFPVETKDMGAKTE